jgi:DNA-binding NarL/FixJ family response regulator
VSIRVVVADDQGMVRSGFSTLLNAQPDIEVVGEAVNGKEAIARAAELRPDVMLMDVRMPVLDGLQATRQVAAMDGAPRVLVLTTFDLDDYVYEALRAGASGFLLKDASAGELAEAVRVVAAGDALLSPGVTRRLIAEFARMGAPRSPSRKNLEDLTERETEVLALVARGMSNAEIAAHLVVAEQTVKTHVSRVLMKLGLRDRAQAVVFAYESGLIRPGELARFSPHPRRRRGLSGRGRRSGRTRAGWPGIRRAWPARPIPAGSRTRSRVPGPCRSCRRNS